MTNDISDKRAVSKAKDTERKTIEQTIEKDKRRIKKSQ